MTLPAEPIEVRAGDMGPHYEGRHVLILSAAGINGRLVKVINRDRNASVYLTIATAEEPRGLVYQLRRTTIVRIHPPEEPTP